MDEKLMLKCLSRNLVELKKTRGLTTDGFTEQCGINKSTFEKYLYCISVMSLDTAMSICSQLNVSINVLFDGLVKNSNDQDAISNIFECFSVLSDDKREQIWGLIDPYVRADTEGLPILKGAKCGTRIRIIRDDYKISAQDVAKSGNIDEDTLKVYESCEKLPGLFTFVGICNALNISPEYLLCAHLETTSLEDNVFLYNLTPRQLEALAETSKRLCTYYH